MAEKALNSTCIMCLKHFYGESFVPEATETAGLGACSLSCLTRTCFLSTEAKDQKVAEARRVHDEWEKTLT